MLFHSPLSLANTALSLSHGKDAWLPVVGVDDDQVPFAMSRAAAAAGLSRRLHAAATSVALARPRSLAHPLGQSGWGWFGSSGRWTSRSSGGWAVPGAAAAMQRCMCDKATAKIVDVEGGKISEKKPDEVSDHARILAPVVHTCFFFIVLCCAWDDILILILPPVLCCRESCMWRRGQRTLFMLRKSSRSHHTPGFPTARMT